MKNLKPNRFPLDIQLFAEGDPAGDPPATDPVKKDPEPATKTFTQKDIDDAVSKEKARLKAKYDKQLKTVNGEDTPPADPTKDPVAVDTTPFIQAAAKAEIKAALAMAGVSAEKIPYAVRLIDTAEVLVEGAVSDDKTKKAVEDMLKNFPELKKATGDGTPSFKVGANGQQVPASADQAYADAFRIKKKP
jgi:hypothetical protein